MTLCGTVKEIKSKKVGSFGKKLLPCVFSTLSFVSLSVNHIPFMCALQRSTTYVRCTNLDRLVLSQAVHRRFALTGSDNG